ncbi:MAG: diaminopimelate decarboxylase, partial [Gammaproteobacteria bacterium]|nr:diaminopimelate decarboxylase [Gammaproteobacteria bacterium]
MPISEDFSSRLEGSLEKIVEHYGTPFHIYDEKGIRETGNRLINAFSGIPGFREYYAVKALPNPEILKVMGSMGFGFDCSSVAELKLSRDVGARGEDIMFTSNN